MRKKVLAMLLACAVAVTGAVPAFAGENADTAVLAEVSAGPEESTQENAFDEEAEEALPEDMSGEALWQKKVTLDIKKTGVYGIKVTGCSGQLVKGKIASGSSTLASGGTWDASMERFALRASLKKGTYTLYLSSMSAKYQLFSLSSKSGKCGKNVTYSLEKAKKGYTLVISGSGSTYHYGTSSQDSSGITPWCAVEDIRSVVVEEGVTSLGDYILSGLGTGEVGVSIFLPKTLKKIGTYAFKDTFVKGTLTIPDGVSQIAAHGLGNANASAIKIGANAKLGTVDDWTARPLSYEPGDIEKLGVGIGGSETNKVTVSKKNPYLKTVGGVLFSADGKKLIYYPKSLENMSYSVPEGTECICSGAFNSPSRNLRRIVLPKSLKKLCRYSFVDSRVEEVAVKSSLKKIDRPFLKTVFPTASYYKVEFFFCGDAPTGILADRHHNIKVNYPSGNKTWTKSKREELSKAAAEVGASAEEFVVWTPYRKYKNSITASDITISSPEEIKAIRLDASAKAGRLTFTTDNSLVEVYTGSVGIDHVIRNYVTIPKNFVGKVLITISTTGNPAYKSATKKILLTVE